MRFFVLLFPLLAACTVDHALVRRTEAELERMRKNFKAQEGPPADDASVPLPWTKGQFAVWAIREGDDTTLTSVRIEDADEEAAIVMLTTVNPRVRTTARLTFTRQPHSLAEARDYLTQIIRRRGEEREMTYRFHKDMHTEMRDALEPLWGTLVPEKIEGPREVATTTTATMEGCQPAKGQFVFSPVGLEVRGLLHPAVPITGLVTGKATTGQTIELVEAGWGGGGPAL
ncbi:MAG: hypothetical protein JNK82_17035 [Myxococcaceae bacterium]|nr:hypothetical protein [Myxococcaceae bacterium]